MKNDLQRGIGFLALGAGLLALMVLANGCTSILTNNKQVVAVKTRFFGLMVGASATTQTPEVKLGWGSITYLMAPTSTNGPISAPRYFDTFDLGQGLNPFNTSILDNTGLGDVQISTNATGGAIVPKLPLPPPPMR